MSDRFRKRMKTLRVSIGLSLRQAERKSGVSNESICQIETGHTTNPGIFTVAKLAAAYGATLDELVK